jgi:hypothetical protein
MARGEHVLLAFVVLVGVASFLEKFSMKQLNQLEKEMGGWRPPVMQSWLASDGDYSV